MIKQERPIKRCSLQRLYQWISRKAKILSKTPSNLQINQERALFQNSKRASVSEISQNQEASKTQFLEVMKNHIINFQFNECDDLSQLIDTSRSFGIYGNIDVVTEKLVKHKNSQILGEEMKIKGIAELGAQKFQNIFVAGTQSDKLYAIIFQCLQKIFICFNNYQEIIRFVRIWEKQLWSYKEQFLLKFIHKFTMKINRISGMYWVTVNQPIFDIKTCYDWKIIKKDAQQTEDQETISYFLRCCYVKEFIGLILKHKKITSYPVFLFDKKQRPDHKPERYIPIPPISFFKKEQDCEDMLKEISLKKFRSEGMIPLSLNDEKIKQNQEQIERMEKMMKL